MPYRNLNELPESVRRNLPVRGQIIFKEAFNSAWDQYKNPAKRRGNEDRETVAHKVAWSAVGRSYARNDQGEWQEK